MHGTKMAVRLLVIGCLLVPAVSWSQSPPSADADAGPRISGPPELQARARQAHEALAPLKRDLMTTLKAALADGPVPAVEGCRLAAPGIAEQASTETIRVGRTSDRLRNPDNAPADWMRPLLAEYGQAPPEPGSATVVALDDGSIGYVEPIYVKPLCTTCHGKAIDPALLDHIRDRYPEDAATGYEVGDFRGLFWVVAEKSE